MKRSRTLVLAVTLGIAGAAGLDHAADGARKAPSSTGSRLSQGKIGSAAPSAGAPARIRALGLDDGGASGSGDGGLGLDDGGGPAVAGHAAHGTIGRAGVSPNAAARIAALGFDD